MSLLNQDNIRKMKDKVQSAAAGKKRILYAAAGTLCVVLAVTAAVLTQTSAAKAADVLKVTDTEAAFTELSGKKVSYTLEIKSAYNATDQNTSFSLEGTVKLTADSSGTPETGAVYSPYLVYTLDGSEPGAGSNSVALTAAAGSTDKYTVTQGPIVSVSDDQTAKVQIRAKLYIKKTVNGTDTIVWLKSGSDGSESESGEVHQLYYQAALNAANSQTEKNTAGDGWNIKAAIKGSGTGNSSLALSGDDNITADIYYTLDGSDPGTSSTSRRVRNKNGGDAGAPLWSGTSLETEVLLEGEADWEGFQSVTGTVQIKAAVKITIPGADPIWLPISAADGADTISSIALGDSASVTQTDSTVPGWTITAVLRAGEENSGLNLPEGSAAKAALYYTLNGKDPGEAEENELFQVSAGENQSGSWSSETDTENSSLSEAVTLSGTASWADYENQTGTVILKAAVKIEIDGQAAYWLPVGASDEYAFSHVALSSGSITRSGDGPSWTIAAAITNSSDYPLGTGTTAQLYYTLNGDDPTEKGSSIGDQVSLGPTLSQTVSWQDYGSKTGTAIIRAAVKVTIPGADENNPQIIWKEIETGSKDSYTHAALSDSEISVKRDTDSSGRKKLVYTIEAAIGASDGSVAGYAGENNGVSIVYTLDGSDPTDGSAAEVTDPGISNNNKITGTVSYDKTGQVYLRAALKLKTRTGGNNEPIYQYILLDETNDGQSLGWQANVNLGAASVGQTTDNTVYYYNIKGSLLNVDTAADSADAPDYGVYIFVELAGAGSGDSEKLALYVPLEKFRELVKEDGGDTEFVLSADSSAANNILQYVSRISTDGGSSWSDYSASGADSIGRQLSFSNSHQVNMSVKILAASGEPSGESAEVSAGPYQKRVVVNNTSGTEASGSSYTYKITINGNSNSDLGQVISSNTTAQMYYTLNGTEPEQAGNSLSEGKSASWSSDTSGSVSLSDTIDLTGRGVVNLQAAVKLSGLSTTGDLGAEEWISLPGMDTAAVFPVLDFGESEMGKYKLIASVPGNGNDIASVAAVITTDDTDPKDSNVTPAPLTADGGVYSFDGGSYIGTISTETDVTVRVRIKVTLTDGTVVWSDAKEHVFYKWDYYTVGEGENQTSIGNFEFYAKKNNTENYTLRDFEFIVDNYDMTVYVDNADQLTAVLSGLKRSYTEGGITYTRDAYNITFRLRTDFSLSNITPNLYKGELTDGVDESKTTSCFSGDTFDGGFHTITIAGVKSGTIDLGDLSGEKVWGVGKGNSALEDTYMYDIGGLFGRVENATIKNLTVELTGAQKLKITAAWKNNLNGTGIANFQPTFRQIGIGVLSGGAVNTSFENVTVSGSGSWSVDTSSIFTNLEDYDGKTSTNAPYAWLQFGVGGLAGFAEDKVSLYKCVSEIGIGGDPGFYSADNNDVKYAYGAEQSNTSFIYMYGGLVGMTGGALDITSSMYAGGAIDVTEVIYTVADMSVAPYGVRSTVVKAGLLGGYSDAVKFREADVAAITIKDCLIQGNDKAVRSAAGELLICCRTGSQNRNITPTYNFTAENIYVAAVSGTNTDARETYDLRMYKAPNPRAGFYTSWAGKGHYAIPVSETFGNAAYHAANCYIAASELHEPIGADWYYTDEDDAEITIEGHRLLPLDNEGQETYFLEIGDVEMSDVDGDENFTINVTVSGWFDGANKSFLGDSAVENIEGLLPTAMLYYTENGSDPRKENVGFGPIGTSQTSKDGGAYEFYRFGDDLVISIPLKYSGGEAKTYKAVARVTFHIPVRNTADTGDTAYETVVLWGDTAERTYSDVDKYISDPLVKMKEEDDEEYMEFNESKAYSLGTTSVELSRKETATSEYDMYYYFGSGSGLTLNELGGLQYVMSKGTKYDSPFVLTKDALMTEGSNQVYLYVLAYYNAGGKAYSALYEYDIVIYEQDGLINASVENGSALPDGGRVTFLIGNGNEGEYPFSSARVLISDVEKSYTTLEGVNGVKFFSTPSADEDEDSGGDTEDPGDIGDEGWEDIDDEDLKDTEDGDQPGNAEDGDSSEDTDDSEDSGDTSAEEDIYRWLQAQIRLWGDPGDTYYVYVEPIVNTTEDAPEGTLPYANRYSGFVQTYTYTIMERAAQPALSPTTITVAETGEGTSIAANSYIYMTSDGRSDILVYRLNREALTAAIVTEDRAELFENLEASNFEELGLSCTAVGDNGYCLNDSGEVAYVRSNGEWYELSEGAQLYEDNKVCFDSSQAGSRGHLSVLRFTSGQDLSASTVYAYEVEKTAVVSAPSALTASGSTVTMGSSLNFSGDEDCVIYYALNGTSPKVTVAEDGTLTAGAGTYLYDSSAGIAIDTSNFSYGQTVTIELTAYPVDENGLYDDSRTQSSVVTYTYIIAEQEQAGSITVTPGTASKVVAGDKILLTSATSGAAIYYTTDGTEPAVIREEDGSCTPTGSTELYNATAGVVVPEGTGYFVLQAMAVKDGMADSESVQYVYTYADAVGAPYGSPPSGTVTENTSVLLLCSQSDAVIYYEIAYDGKTPSDPTLASSVFSADSPIVITRNTTIKAFAYHDRSSSEIVTLKYTLADKMTAPSASTDSGSIVPNGTTVKLSASAGNVYYTTDGSDPADASNTAVNVGGSLVLTGNPGDTIVIKACTMQTGATPSDVVTYTYQISQYAGGVAADTESGSTLSAGSTVYLYTDVTGGTIYYTTGSGTPETEGSSVVLEGNPGDQVSIKAVAAAPGTTMTGSYAFFTYSLKEQLAAPRASVAGGTVLTEAASVVLAANEGTIYYTIDGTDPTKESYVYSAPIVVSRDMTIKAIAMADDKESSAVSTFSYTFANQAAAVKASAEGGALEPGTVVYLSSGSAGAAIYYTVDGSDPDPDAEEGTFLYDAEEGIKISRGVTIKAVAVTDGLQNSGIFTVTYTVDGVPIEIEKEKQARKEAEEGLQPLDASTLEERRAEAAEGLSVREVVLKEINYGAVLGGTTENLPEDASLSAKEISVPGSSEDQLQQQLGEEYEFIVNYDFALYRNGQRIQPNGEVEIGIPIPEGYEDADVVIVYINENGGITIHETRRSGSYAYANVSHFSNYAIAGAVLDDGFGWSITLEQILMLLAAALVAAGGFMIYRNISGRKRTDFE